MDTKPPAFAPRFERTKSPSRATILLIMCLAMAVTQHKPKEVHARAGVCVVLVDIQNLRGRVQRAGRIQEEEGGEPKRVDGFHDHRDEGDALGLTLCVGVLMLALEVLKERGSLPEEIQEGAASNFLALRNFEFSVP